MIRLVIIISFLLLHVNIFSQNFKIIKTTDPNPISNQSIIYALPRTGLTVNLILTKTTIKKGIYADYAKKYLGMENVPLSDSIYWTITDTEIVPYNETDPEQLYTLTFKTFPSNIQNLLSNNNQGIILNPSDKWLEPYRIEMPMEEKLSITDPHIIDEILKEKSDTTYKTIQSDSTYIRIPVFKKQITAKTQEDIIKEAAHQLIKTRKRKIKLMRGEYQFHPDGATLKIMFDEMQNQEKLYLSLFQGSRIETRKTYSFNIMPQKDSLKIELCSFDNNLGITDLQNTESEKIYLQLNNKETTILIKQIPSEKQELNTLYYRTPAYINTSLIFGTKNIIDTRIPFYQFGIIRILPINYK